MRTLFPGERDTSRAGLVKHLIKFESTDGDGVYQDWSSYFVGATWGATRDQPVVQATLRVRRREGSSQSLAPLMTGSSLNVYSGGYAPAIDKGRKVRLWTATIDPAWGNVDSSWLFRYGAGDDISVFGEIFSGLGTKTFVSAGGVLQTNAADVLRGSHFIGGFRHALIEIGRTQILANPQTPAGWTDFGTPVITTAQPDPWGGSVAVLLNDDDAVNREGKQQAVTFTGDGTKAVAFAVRAGTATQIVCGVRDITAGNVDRHAVSVTWNGAAAPTVATSTGAGTVFSSVGVFDGSGNLWWIIQFSANSVIAANSNTLFAVVNAGTTGTFYLAGANAWNAVFPTSWQPSLNHARSADYFRYTSAPTPRELTVYLDFVELGNLAAGTTGPRYFQISNNADASPRLYMAAIAGGTVQFQYGNGTASATKNTGATPWVYGDRVEARITLYADGSLSASYAVNGGAEVDLGRSAAPAGGLNAAWSGNELGIGCIPGGTSQGGIGFRSLVIASGVQTMNAGRAVAAHRRAFEGRIDSIDWGNSPMILSCSDDGAWLMDTQIETEQVLSNGTGIAVETVMQTILNTWPSGIGVPTLYTPASPGWNIKTYTQDRVKVLEAVRALALQIGYDLRFRYDADDVHRLTFLDPNRARVSVDTSIGPAEYSDVRRLAVDIARIRNTGKVTFLKTDGTIGIATYTDAASVAKHGRRYMELPSAKNIDTQTEADKYVTAVIQDLADSGAEQEIDTLFLWFVQLFDRYTFVANGDHYDVDQTLSVVGYQHTFENHHGRTAIQVAGRVIGAYDTWYRRWLDVYDVPSLDVRATPGSVSYTITYAVNAEVFQYSTNNGAFTTVPASGFTVSRPGAGSNSTALTFKATKNNQTITNTIFVPAVDQDTVTPDLTVTQTAQNDTTTSFQATASNPQGGGAPTITVFFVNCTSSTGHTNGQTIASGTTVGVNRPSFSGGQATVRFRAVITSAGAEEISRTVPNQVYDPATDPENMVVNGGGQDGTVGSLATGWTLDSSNPLVVANDKAKFGDRSLKITNASLAVSASRQDFNVVDGATYEISAWVEMTSVTGGGVALQVSIVSGVTSFEIFDKICPTDPDPTTPTMKVGTGTAVFQFIRCLFRVNGTGVIRAYTILGYGATSTGDTWFDGLQLKRVARLAPNLRVWASEGTTSDTIYYEVDADAVLVYRTDNGGDSTPAASGFTVSRNTAGGAKKVLTFTATRAGQKKVCTIEVLPKVPASATDTTAVITSIYYVSTDYALDDLVIGWRYTGALGSGQFDIQWLDQSGVTADLSAAPSHKAYDSVSSSPATYTHDFSGLYDLQSGAGPKRTFSYQIRVLNSNGDVVSTSGWISRIETAV